MSRLEQLLEAQRKGEALLMSLTEEEKTILMGYSYLAAGSLMQLGARQGAAVNDLVMNGVRVGIALGSQINISKGAITRRVQ